MRGGKNSAALGAAPHPSPLPAGGERGQVASAEKEVLKNKNETHERITFSARFACPGVGLHHRGDRAAAVLVQRAGRRLPQVRRSRHRDAVRGGPGGARSDDQPEEGRGLSLGQDRQHLALLRADAGGAGQALQGVDDDAVGEAAQEGAGRHPVRHRRRGGRVRLRGRRPQVQERQAVRGRDRQHRAPLPRDRERLGARGAVALPGGASVRRLRRLSPEAAGAGGEDRRAAHRPGDGYVHPHRQRLVRRAAEEALQEAERDRGPHPQGDPRAAAVPGRRGARLSHAVARGRHAVGRREPAHPAGLADRLGPDRRAVRAGRALHRPAPARQRPPAGDAQAPARHRQHRDRGGARRGRDPHRRPRGRHRPRRGHPRRQHRGPGHARRHHGELRQHHRAVPDRRAPDPDAQGSAARRTARR